MGADPTRSSGFYEVVMEKVTKLSQQKTVANSSAADLAQMIKTKAILDRVTNLTDKK